MTHYFPTPFASVDAPTRDFLATRGLVTTPRNEGMAAEPGWGRANYWNFTPATMQSPVEDDLQRHL